MDSITRYNDYLNQETTGEEFKTFLEGKTVEEAGVRRLTLIDSLILETT